jgi:Porin subfamily
VKVCSLYGQGFYYIPGTETCIKLGGFLRVEWDANAGGSFTTFTNGANAQFFRGGDQLTTRSRAVLTGDVREQTAYGTLRAYFAGGWQYTTNDAPTLSLAGSSVASGGGAASSANTNNSNAYLLRAFVQWGGFTLGKTASFFDFFSTSKYTHQTNFLWQEFGGVGINTWGYTQQLGNGLAASIAVEDNTFFAHPVRDLQQAFTGTATIGGTGGAFGGTFFPIQVAGGPTNGTFNNAGFQVPDIVGSLRVDQAWGGAQVALALHDNRTRYYQNTANGLTAGVAHPGDKWGWAGMAGVELNLANVGWAKGDTLAVQSQYCVGTSEHCYDNSGSRQADLAWSLVNTNRIGLGWLDDGFESNIAATGATGIQLSTAWNVVAAIQHYWVPDLRTSLYGAYATWKANSSAVDALVCAPAHAANAAVSASGCADWAAWQIGSRTIWNPTRNLDIGVDVVYSDLNKSAFDGAKVTFAPAGVASNTFTVGSAHVVSAIARVQYNFYP